MYDIRLANSTDTDGVTVLLHANSPSQGGASAYVYGPVCIAGSERGRGLLAQLYAVMRAQYPDGEAVLFIRRDNIASMRAHQRLGMHEVASFILDDLDYAVLSDRGIR